MGIRTSRHREDHDHEPRPPRLGPPRRLTSRLAAQQTLRILRILEGGHYLAEERPDTAAAAIRTLTSHGLELPAPSTRRTIDMTTTTAPRAHRAVAAGPPKLEPDELLAAQQQTLDTPHLKYSLLAKMMFKPVDLLYGKQGSLTKFVVLEIIARVPYQAWERMGCWAVHRYAARSAVARRVFDRMVEARADQDNEQWHLLILQDLVQRNGTKQTWLLHRAIPWLIAFFYYHVSWLLFLIKPRWSYRLNAEFEDHAEHVYMN